MTNTPTLADFLLSRLDEDEAAARAVTKPLFFAYKLPDDDREAWTEHIHRHEPARVLADCAARRQIVERLSLYASSAPLDSYVGHAASLVDVLRILAEPYAAHEDYRDEWKP